MSDLSPKQRHAGQLIAAGHTHRQVAKTVGVTPQTVSEWVSRPELRDYVDAMLLAAQQETAQTLAGLRLRAVERLGGLLEHEAPGIALRAIETALDLTAPRTQSTSIPMPSDNGAWGAIIAKLNAHEVTKSAKPN
ncbi:helix-turn-helix domain-containing protein [Lysobacter niastensis]|uniref:helix-turn-helix domain-containing protein n=1 Tax=Lysobacter niastensis TaxID=380629 RepID=UPI003D2F9BA5